jgi:DNA-binding CsgD family transcriptional regulator
MDRHPLVQGIPHAVQRVYSACMAIERARTRCLEQLDGLAGSNADLIDVRLTAIDELKRVLGFERWCAMLADPDSLLLSRGMSEHSWGADIPRLNQLSAAGHDTLSFPALARSTQPVTTLFSATGGDYARSPVWEDIFGPHGCGDELRCAISDKHGTWGVLMLFRSSDQRPFDDHDIALLRDGSASLARALRRAAVAPIAEAATGPSTTAVVVADDQLRLLGKTDTADAWFDALNPERLPFPDGIPGVIWAVAGRLQANERGQLTQFPPTLRVRVAGGSWAVIEASRLTGPTPAPITITIRPARGDEILSLLARAHGLSARERDIMRRVIDGHSTAQIADALYLSRYTVEDHIKAVLIKVGVRSRRELANAIFAA